MNRYLVWYTLPSTSNGRRPTQRLGVFWGTRESVLEDVRRDYVNMPPDAILFAAPESDYTPRPPKTHNADGSRRWLT